MSLLMVECLQIEWNLGNECGYKCTYCHKELNDGRNTFPSKDSLFPAFAHIIEQTREFLSLQIDITGGEPSESPALRDLLEAHTDQRIKFRLISNGSADLTWWQSIKNNLYAVQLTYHTKGDFDHFYSVVNELKQIRPRIMLPLEPHTWASQKQIFDILTNMGYDVHLQMLYKNFTRGNSEYLSYTQDQWNEYYISKGVNPYQEQEVVQTIEFKRMNSLNNYLGHLCWAGVDQIVIDNFGDVWRGWCRSNNSMGNIYKQTMILDVNPRVCPRTQCRNGFDLQAKKSNGSWGFV